MDTGTTISAEKANWKRYAAGKTSCKHRHHLDRGDTKRHTFPTNTAQSAKNIGKAMKHRSPTNSRKHENPELYEQYRIDNPECETCEIINGFKSHAAQRHHLFGGTLRHDSLSNLISVCLFCHGWIHANSREGRVICLWVKQQKGEIDFEELNTASGKIVRTWIDNDDHRMACEDTKYEELRLDLLETWDCES